MKNEPAPSDIALLLDANCLIYYCQRFDERIRGTAVKFYHPLSDRVLEAVEPMIPRGCIGSTLAVINEIPDKGAQELVDDFTCNSEIRSILAANGITRVPPMLEERWRSRFMQKFKKLRYNEWFMEIDFTPSETELDEARAFYKSLASKPTMLEHIARKGKACPSDEDLGLVICAKTLQIPILSNDGDFTKFVDDWDRFGVRINPLTHPGGAK